MATDYAKMAMEMKWENLDELWTRIVDESPMPEWVAGRAFEHLVLRMVQLDGAEVTWPFSVKLYEEEVEQIDGAVYWNGMACLVECKDQNALIAFEPVAKLRNQLLRRLSRSDWFVFQHQRFHGAGEVAGELHRSAGYLALGRSRCPGSVGETQSDENSVEQVSRIRRAGRRIEGEASSMKTYLVVESERDRAILKAVLPPDRLASVEIENAGRRSRLSTVGTSLLISERCPVALVLDAGTVDPAVMSERRDWFDATFLHFALPGTPARFIQAVPAIEGIFFAGRSILERIFGQSFPETVWVQAKYSPNDALRSIGKLVGRDVDALEIAKQLNDADLEAIRGHPFIVEVMSFLDEAASFAHGNSSNGNRSRPERQILLQDS